MIGSSVCALHSGRWCRYAVRCDPAGLGRGGRVQCFYETTDGTRWPDRHNWEGVQPAKEQGDRVGMLLDLDQGSMTLWKNDVRLGVMWAVRG